jgi:S-DNA-T family DNA segregation ATPase FtsK/SpoIIIE
MRNYDNYTPEISYADDLPAAESIAQKEDSQKSKPTKVQHKKPKKTAKKKDTQPNDNNVKQSSDKEPLTTRIQNFIKSPSFRIVAGVFFTCLTVYMLVTFISYFTACIQDQSIINSSSIGYAGKVQNAGGEGGARIAEFLINECFGLGSLVIVIWLGGFALKFLVGKPRFKTVNFTIKCLVALITVSIIVGLSTIASHSAVNWGGYHGIYVNEFIVNFVGWTGAILLSVFLVVLFVVICMRDFVLWIMRVKKKHAEKRRLIAEEKAAQLAKEAELAKMRSQEHIDDLKAGESSVISTQEIPDQTVDTHVSFQTDDAPIYSLDPDDDIDSVASTPEEQASEDVPVSSADESSDITPITTEAENVAATEHESGVEPTAPADSEASETTQMVVNVNTVGQSSEKHFKSEVERYESHKYKFPPYDILRPGQDRISVDETEQMENKEKIERTLLDFGIAITDIQATVGPTVTLYEIVPDKGVKIAKIRSLADDIARSLSATAGVRIIAPIPGKGTVGIEVANKDKLTVSMRTVIQSKKFQNNHYNLPIALGCTISNDVYMADLTKMPHLLVAGATGQGKSVGLNAIIASLLYCKAPYELKFVMIDPKQVEFSLYNRLRDHYMAMIPSAVDDNDEPVITDMKKVEATLAALCIEMDDRYSLLKAAHVRNIEEYNNKIKEGKLNPADGHRFLPYIVVIVDEFGDLVMVSGKAVETPIARLGQKARAVGMHVIIATQRPSTNVITGIIKANFPARISFKVSSGVDSKTILDCTGAQTLIGRGDMLIFHNSEMVRVQCAFIDTPEVEEICEYVEKQPYPTGPYLLPEPAMDNAEGGSVGGTASLSDRDTLFEEVARSIVNAGTASTSSVQRHYGVGYVRAGKIMDQLEAAGIVGPSQGGKPRAVLVDAMSLEDILRTLE